MPFSRSPASSAPDTTHIRRRLLVAVLLSLGLLAGACGTDVPETGTTAPQEGTAEDPSAPGSRGGRTGTAPSQSPTTAQTVQDDVAVTPSGIPVAVLDTDADGHVVRAPCGDDVVVQALQPLGPVDVVIDPGHGGPVDTGAVGANGLVESDLNLAVAQALADELEGLGLSSVLTRTGDYAVPIPVRTDFADRAGAHLLVSIHHNAPVANPSPTPGTEMFVQLDTPESARLGALLQAEVTAALSKFDVNWVSARDAGVLEVVEPDGTESYGLVRRATIPAVLAELGYLANPAEAAFFAADAYPEIAAAAMAEAIDDYLHSNRFIGFAPERRVFTAGHSHATQSCANPALGG